jgi:aspartate/methionine/tyrosine aminotransferase
MDPEHSIVTTSFTKAYGLGGLKLGIALAKKELVDELYTDVLNTVGNSPNIVQLLASELLSKNMDSLEKHQQKWVRLKTETEKWFNEKNIQHFRSIAGVTYWLIPRYGLALVPGTFFLFENDYKTKKSNMLRLGIGDVNPDRPNLQAAFETLEKAIKTYELH